MFLNLLKYHYRRTEGGASESDTYSVFALSVFFFATKFATQVTSIRLLSFAFIHKRTFHKSGLEEASKYLELLSPLG